MEWKSETNSKTLYRQSRNSTFGLYVTKDSLLPCFVFQNDTFSNIDFASKIAEDKIMYDNRNNFVFPFEQSRSEERFSIELKCLQKHNISFSSSPELMCLKCFSAEHVSEDLVFLNLLGIVFLTDFERAMRRFTTRNFSSIIEDVVKTYGNSLFLEGLCRFKQEKDDIFKGLGTKMVMFCIMEAKKRNKNIFLTVFDYSSDNNIHNSHEFLVNYYTDLGFTFECNIKHLNSDIQYTLMRLS
jgi:hypothetical protein